MIDLIVEYIGLIGSFEMEITRELQDFKYCYIFSVMFARRSAALKKYNIFIYLLELLFEK